MSWRELAQGPAVDVVGVVAGDELRWWFAGSKGHIEPIETEREPIPS
jgi:hypothetical protein